MKKEDQKLYIAVAFVFVLGLIIWFTSNKDDKPKDGNTNPVNNCIKLNITGDDVREWVNVTFTVDGIKYDTIRRFVSNHRSTMVFNSSVNNNSIFSGLWKDGEYINTSTLFNQNSNVSVELKFLASDFYPETRIESYNAEVINCS